MATLIDYILIPLDLKESCQCIMHGGHEQLLSDWEVSKANQSRWPSNFTGFHGHPVMRKESTKIWLLTHWPIEIGRKSKTAQLWKESLYAPLWPECLYAYPVGKKFNACQANWQIRSSSHAEKRSCQSENWLSIRKNGFLTELKYICCKLGPFCVKFHLGQSRTNPLL